MNLWVTLEGLLLKAFRSAKDNNSIVSFSFSSIDLAVDFVPGMLSLANYFGSVVHSCSEYQNTEIPQLKIIHN